MKLDAWDIFSLVLEGQDDARYRRVAERVLETVADKIAKRELKGKSREEKGVFYVVYDLDKVSGGQGMELWLGVTPDVDSREQGGAYIPRTSGKKIAIKIVAFDEKQDAQTWKKKMDERAAIFLRKNREVFVHEYIHHMDRQRITPTAYTKQVLRAAGSDGDGYYNNPLEMNAFVQQGMSNMVNSLKRTKTPMGRKNVVGDSPQVFFKNLLRHMDPGFTKNLSPNNRKKLAKRAYQLWGELVSQQPTPH